MAGAAFQGIGLGFDPMIEGLIGMHRHHLIAVITGHTVGLFHAAAHRRAKVTGTEELEGRMADQLVAIQVARHLAPVLLHRVDLGAPAGDVTLWQAKDTSGISGIESQAEQARDIRVQGGVGTPERGSLR